jgi:flagellar protein FlbD
LIGNRNNKKKGLKIMGPFCGRKRGAMVKLTRLDGSKLLINIDLIETIEETPDTIVILTNGHRYIVRENLNEVMEKIIAYRNRISFKKTLVFEEKPSSID